MPPLLPWPLRLLLVVWAVSAILANLAVNESNLDAIREAHGLRPLVELLTQRDISDNLRLKAVWALSNLLVNDDNQVRPPIQMPMRCVALRCIVMCACEPVSTHTRRRY